MIHAGDLFCGAGGTSTGLALACRELGKPVDLVAINHWKAAVETHKANHPWARHIPERLEADEAQPRVAVPGGRLDVLAASPECTHHARARGSRPMLDQSRATAWHVLKWCESLRVDSVLVENIPEFMSWGPLGRRGRPIKSRRGDTWRAWLEALRSLGYYVDHRILNAADFGEATTRKRLFVIASRRRSRISWPSASHSREGEGAAKWRAAQEIIDWTLVGDSIFERDVPLAKNTLARIEAGLRRYGGSAAEPFIVLLRGGGCKGAGGVRGVDEPLSTISAQGTHHALVQPFLVPFYGEREGQEPRTHSVEEPLPVQPASPKFGLCLPFVLGQQSGAVARGVDRPLPTVSTSGAISLVVPYYGATKSGRPVTDPLGTITTKDRFGLVEPVEVSGRLDIRFRMLRKHELAAAMGFPDGYRFMAPKYRNERIPGTRKIRKVFVGVGEATNAEAVRMIGNAVSVRQSKALFRGLIA